MPSIFWIGVIVVGALCVAIGNIYYPISRQQEQRRSAEQTVNEILKDELRYNLNKIKSQKKLSETEISVSMSELDVSAWQIVMRSDLLINLKKENRDVLIRIYTLLNKANYYHRQLMEQGLGMSSSLHGKAVGEARKKISANYMTSLEEAGGLIANFIEQ